MTERKNGKMNTIGAIASVGIIGAGLALLFAPKSGRKTRRSLAHMGRKAQKRAEFYRSEIADGIEHAFQNIRDDVKSCAAESKNWTEDQIARIEQALHNGRKKIEAEMDRVFYS